MSDTKLDKVLFDHRHKSKNTIKQQIKDLFIEIVDKPRDIYLTKEDMAIGGIGEDVVIHWDTLRVKLTQEIEKL